jgi:hypothetical protein
MRADARDDQENNVEQRDSKRNPKDARGPLIGAAAGVNVHFP